MLFTTTNPTTVSAPSAKFTLVTEESDTIRLLSITTTTTARIGKPRRIDGKMEVSIALASTTPDTIKDADDAAYQFISACIHDPEPELLALVKATKVSYWETTVKLSKCSTRHYTAWIAYTGDEIPDEDESDEDEESYMDAMLDAYEPRFA